MKNVSFTKLDSIADELSKKIDLPTLADALNVAKIARKRAEAVWEKLRSIVSTSGITEAESDSIQVNATFRKGCLRWDTEKLNALMLKYNLKAENFKKQDNDSLLLTIKSK